MEEKKITIGLDTFTQMNEGIEKMRSSLLDLLDEVKGMHTLLNRFEEDAVMNSYNVGKNIDPDKYIETLENVFPLIVHNYKDIADRIDHLTEDLDHCALSLAKGA